MHGLGNDFVIIGPGEKIKITKKLIRNISNRKHGIGCDLVVVLDETKLDYTDLKANFYNSDGSSAEICGNALRCVGKLFFNQNKKSNLIVETDSKLIEIELENDGNVRVDMGIPKFDWKDIPLSKNLDSLNLGINFEYLQGGLTLNLGNPHLVFFSEVLDKKKIMIDSKKILLQSMFPEGVNISVVKVLSRNIIEVITLERGVGLTDACGSGACASAMASLLRKFVDPKTKVIMRGGDLDIEISPNNNISMLGGANFVFTGDFDLKHIKSL